MFGKKKAKSSYRVPLQEIQFVCEQDGIPEKELKTQLTKIFIKDRGIQRAYLVRISYKCSDEYLVALCLSISSGLERPRVKKVSRCFSSIFGDDQHLEILFLTPELQSQVDKVCVPFYVKGNKGKKPDFYMVSSEWKPLHEPRECWIKDRFKSYSGNDLYLVQIKPSILYDEKIYGTIELNELIIASRHEGYTISEINEWPFYIYLATHSKKEPFDGNELVDEGNLERIAWAELYPSFSTAKKAINIE